MPPSSSAVATRMVRARARYAQRLSPRSGCQVLAVTAIRLPPAGAGPPARGCTPGRRPRRPWATGRGPEEAVRDTRGLERVPVTGRQVEVLALRGLEHDRAARDVLHDE